MTINKKVTELHQHFEKMLTEARRNEQTLKKFQTFELALVNATSIGELMTILLDNSRHQLDWDPVTLTLVDNDRELRNLFHRIGYIPENSIQIFNQGYSLCEIYGDVPQPVLGRYTPEKHAFMFPRVKHPPASVGLLPLVRDQKLIGSYNIGSHDRSRFDTHTATDFLQHLAAIVAVSIEILVTREQFKYLGLVDKLTEVNNRHFFDQRLHEEIERTKRTEKPMSCLFIDADHFKQINDTHGHENGDRVLQHIASIIRNEVRTIDIVSRYGGEEFTVLLLQSGRTAAMEVAERIRSRIEATPLIIHNDQPVALTVSIGSNTLYPAQCDKAVNIIARSFIEKADSALYRAKNSGRNRVVNHNHQDSGNSRTA